MITRNLAADDRISHFGETSSTGQSPQSDASLPGLTRQSIALRDAFQMDARVKPAHDDLEQS
jgi:hypothetical protein